MDARTTNGSRTNALALLGLKQAIKSQGTGAGREQSATKTRGSLKIMSDVELARTQTFELKHLFTQLRLMLPEIRPEVQQPLQSLFEQPISLESQMQMTR
jgi:hypothetical protein